MPAEELVLPSTPAFGEYKPFLEHAAAHPAKMNTKLIEFLIETWTKPNETVLDPMAGSGSLGVIAALHGRNAVQVELEKKFYDWMEQARENIEKHPALTPKGWIKNICGDARRLSELLGRADVAITSPPYSSTEFYYGEKSPEFWQILAEKTGRKAWLNPDSQTRKTIDEKEKPLSPENIGNLPLGNVDTVITSPPYAESKAFQDLEFMEKTAKEQSEKVKKGEIKGHYMTEEARKKVFQKMVEGEIQSEQNISNLPFGQVDSIITSPPYVESVNAPNDPERRAQRMLQAGLNPKKIVGGKARCGQMDWQYGQSEGQIGNLPLGEISTIITSPPYGEAQEGSGIAKRGYQSSKDSPTDLVGERSYMPNKFENPENISRLPLGNIDTIITSPPYAETITQGGTTKCYKEKYGYQQEENKGYSESKGNIGNLTLGDINCCITSPPYEGSLEGTSRHTRGGIASRDPALAQTGSYATVMSFGVHVGYSPIKDNIGNLKTETCLNDLIGLLEIIDGKPYKSVKEVYSVWFTIKRYTNVTTSFIRKKSELRQGSGCDSIEKLTLAKIVEDHVQSQPKDAEGVIVYGGKAWGYIYQKKQEEKLVRQTNAHGQPRGNLRLLPIEGDLSPSLAVLTRLFGREGIQDGEEKVSMLQELDSSTLLVLNANYAELKLNTRIFTMLSRLQKAVKIPKTTLLFYVISAIVQSRMNSTHEGSQNLEPYAKYLALASQLWQFLNPSKPTYLSEMFKVYSEMFRVLKPNGKAVVVVKPFIRNKKVVDLPWHTWLLMQSVGFQLAKLYKLRLKQESFWRILYYKKHPEVPRLQHEYVLVCQKPSDGEQSEALIAPQV